MKRLILFILLIPRITFGQDINSTERRGANNVYTDAIKQYLTFIENQGKIKLDKFIIEQKGHYLDSISPSIKDTYIQFANASDIDKLLEKGNSFVLYGLSPLSFDKGQFFISIVPFVSTKDRGDGVRLEVSGGSKIIYSFDSKSRNFKFIKVENWGI
jgi:hypothetical protein